MTRAEIIIRTVADWYELRPDEILSDSRMSEITWPRQVAMWVMDTHADMSEPHIGRVFGGRDHTTVRHAIARVNQKMQDEWTGNEVRLVEAECLYRMSVISQRIRAAAEELRA